MKQLDIPSTRCAVATLVPMSAEESKQPVFYDYGVIMGIECLVAWTRIGICVTAPKCGHEMEFLMWRFPQARPAEWDGPTGICHIRGTQFQIDVWSELLKIPYGCTVTYSEIAKAIGRPRATRAVGTAVGSNPVSLLIPCHRVIPARGGVGGYYWGRALKEKLLEMERKAYEELKIES